MLNKKANCILHSAFCILHSSFRIDHFAFERMRWFISIRYFLTHKRQSFVCIAGVTISVMMFITMTSLMNGLTDKFIIETVESTGHITIKDEPRETRTAILEAKYPGEKALLELEGTKPREQTKK